MSFSQYFPERRKLARGVAPICGILMAAALAGCSSKTFRFDDGWDGYSHGSTGAVAEPPAYNGYNGNGYNGYNGDGYNGYNGNGRKRAGPDAVERNGIPPVAGDENGEGDCGNGYNGNGHNGSGYYKNGRCANGYNGNGRNGVSGHNGRKPYNGGHDGNGYYPDHDGENGGGHNGDGCNGGACKSSGYNGHGRNGRNGNGHNGNGHNGNGHNGNGRYGDNGRNGNGNYGNGYAAVDGPGAKHIKVEKGDTLFTIARRHRVTVEALSEANGLANASIRSGQELIVPANGHGGARSANLKNDERLVLNDAPRSAPRRPGGAANPYSSRYAGPRVQRYAAHNGNGPNSGDLKPAPITNGGGPKRANGAKHAGEVPHPEDAPDEGPDTARLDAAPEQGKRNANGRAGEKKVAAKSSGEPPAGGETAPAKECEDLLSNPLPRSGKTFREPVQGLIISKFGIKDDGSYNDGINVSVPKGTPVKAAENGVVAYAGNELSGFGNLILIRHADDYVTAYAHNDALLVKRCDVIKRGQIIAKAGASGSVNKPQLHFELRKNSKAVDPSPLLGGS